MHQGHLCFLIRKNALDSVAAITPSITVSIFLPFMTCTAELGECELPEHTPELVSEFRFIPNQTEAMEFDIFQRWKECRYLVRLSRSEQLLTLCYVFARPL